ncbi:unnamed protein product [Gadus morhua 'NCC']
MGAEPSGSLESTPRWRSLGERLRAASPPVVGRRTGEPGTGRPADQRTRGPGDQRQEYQGTGGPGDQRQEDRGTRGHGTGGVGRTGSIWGDPETEVWRQEDRRPGDRGTGDVGEARGLQD